MTGPENQHILCIPRSVSNSEVYGNMVKHGFEILISNGRVWFASKRKY